MKIKNKINLFYWSSKVFENKEQENYGDLLSVYLVEKISKKKVVFYNAPKKRKALFQKNHLMAIGSIMSYATKKSFVWGTGIISKKDIFKNANFLAVRGPKTRERVMELGYDCPEVYGDPALLLPNYYKPHIQKTHSYGIIPHYVDYKQVARQYKNVPEVKVINLLGDDIEEITKEILSCEYTLSSSLHGIIVSHAYGIPSVWVRFSEKLSGDDVKFEDYFLSIDLIPYKGKWIDKSMKVSEFFTLYNMRKTIPNNNKLEEVKKMLLEAFPEL